MNDLILDRFLNFLLVEKGLSSNTLESYSRDLIYYFRFLEARDITDLSKTQPETLYEYLGSLKGRKLSGRTQARTLSAIKSFYRFMQEESLRKDNPAQPLQGPTPKRSLPKTLSEMEVETLLHQPKPGSPRGLRDMAMLEVLYATGLRVTEVLWYVATLKKYGELLEGPKAGSYYRYRLGQPVAAEIEPGPAE